MVSVGTALSLRVLVLPLLFVCVLFAGSFYYYIGSLDATSFFTGISSLLSSFFVALLVWERLRNSCQNKLEWIHKNALFKLHYEFCSFGDSRFRSDAVAEFTNDLKRYGRFLWIRLYPRNLIGEIEKINPLGAKLEEDLELVKTTALKLGIVDDPVFLWYLGIDPWGRQPSDNPIDQEGQKHQKEARLFLDRSGKLVDEIKDMQKRIRSMKEQICQRLECFMKDNALRMEPSYTP